MENAGRKDEFRSITVCFFANNHPVAKIIKPSHKSSWAKEPCILVIRLYVFFSHIFVWSQDMITCLDFCNDRYFLDSDIRIWVSWQYHWEITSMRVEERHTDEFVNIWKMDSHAVMFILCDVQTFWCSYSVMFKLCDVQTFITLDFWSSLSRLSKPLKRTNWCQIL